MIIFLATENNNSDGLMGDLRFILEKLEHKPIFLFTPNLSIVNVKQEYIFILVRKKKMDC
jgi:hypothetical protein